MTQLFTNEKILKATGVISLSRLIWQTSRLVWTYFLRPYPQLKLRFGEKSYAIVTGGSRGIGFEIARLLADQGLNLILVARNRESLSSAKEEITKQYPTIAVITYSLDASKATEEDVDAFVTEISSLDVSILINNVSIHNIIPSYVQDMANATIQDIISVNCTFHTVLTAKLIPILRRRRTNSSVQSTRRSLIMFISSLTSQLAMPLHSLYAATKAFEEHLSVGLAAELDPDHVDVLCVRPGLTATEMSGIRPEDSTLFVPTAATMAKACIHKIGTETGRISAIAPYFPHALMDYINTWVPSRFSWKIVRMMNEQKRAELLRNKEKLQ